MQRLSFILCFICLFACQNDNQAVTRSIDTKEHILKDYRGKEIVFYNVENLFDTKNDPKTNDDDFLPDSKKKWTPERFSKKIDGIAEVLRKIASDFPILVGLVEIENKHCLKSLTSSKLLEKANYRIIHKDSKDERGMDVAILYRPDYISLLDSEVLTVELENDFTRDILYAHLALLNNSELHVYVNHWPSRREGVEKSELKRMQAAHTVRQHMDKILSVEPKANILVMGDFNDYPSNNSILKGLKSIYSTENWPRNYLFNLANSEDTEGKGTYNYRGDWGMLDQMLVSQNLLTNQDGLSVKEGNFEVFDADWLQFRHPKYKDFRPNRTYGGNRYYGGYSDHLPIKLKLN